MAGPVDRHRWLVKLITVQSTLRRARLGPSEFPGLVYEMTGKTGIGPRERGVASQRVVVKFYDHVQLPYVARGLSQALESQQVVPWKALTASFPGISIGPLHHSVKPDELTKLAERAAQLSPDYHPPNLQTYFVIDCPAGIDPDKVAGALLELPAVETAYVQAPPAPPPGVNGPANPRYPSEGYLQAAPGGIDAHYAWSFTGGDGAGMGFVDMERGWTLNHEDLVAAGITLISGVNQDYPGHGTAVLGEITAVDNTIGDVGIVPHVTARVISQWRTSTSYNTPDAITAAIAVMSFGDVLELEAQTTVVGSTYLPVEVESATFDAIKLATSLGIVVVEAGGNGSNDLDTFTSGGQQILNRSSAAFKDSGAIMVGAASSASPHTRLGFSNYGSRIDCYGWGENIDTTGDGWTGTGTNLYTGTFGGTSGATPIVAGASIAVQAMAGTSLGYRFAPRQLREILKAPSNSTASNDPTNDKIGRMPDLRAIITGSALNLAPDIYLRDYPADDGGVPRPGAYSNSPDIIVTASPPADPTAAYGPGSGTENSTTLGDDVVQARDNSVYLRVSNRGGSAATNATGTAYWSPPAMLVTPNLWNEIGSVVIPNVPVGRVLTVSNAINWPAAQVPGVGHYCFVALVGSANEPAPTPGNLMVWSNFLEFIANNNQVAWHNFNVTPPPPSARGFIELPFLAVGAPLEGVEMALELEAYLPEGAKAYLDAPWSLIDGLKLRSPFIAAHGTHKDRALLPLPPRGRLELGSTFFPAGAQIPLRLAVHLPTKARRHAFQLGARQLYKDVQVGRINWTLEAPHRRVGPPDDDDDAQRSGRRTSQAAHREPRRRPTSRTV